MRPWRWDNDDNGLYHRWGATQDPDLRETDDVNIRSHEAAIADDARLPLTPHTTATATILIHHFPPPFSSLPSDVLSPFNR
jgi:hypothetical protein